MSKSETKLNVGDCVSYNTRTGVRYGRIDHFDKRGTVTVILTDCSPDVVFGPSYRLFSKSEQRRLRLVARAEGRKG